MTFRILFVCSGNLCRSPMAAGLAEKLFAEARISALITSAGTLGIFGSPAAANAVRALAEVGIDLGRHASQGISSLLLRAADHVVIMSPTHEQELLSRDPAVASKIRRLWEHASPQGRLTEIADPVGLPLAAFVACREDLTDCLRNWVQSLPGS